MSKYKLIIIFILILAIIIIYIYDKNKNNNKNNKDNMISLEGINSIISAINSEGINKNKFILKTINSETVNSNLIDSKIINSDSIKSNTITSNSIDSKLINSDSIKSNTLTSNLIDSKNSINSDAIKTNMIIAKSIDSNNSINSDLIKTNMITANSIDSKNSIISDEIKSNMITANSIDSKNSINSEIVNANSLKSNTINSKSINSTNSITSEIINLNKFCFNPNKCITQDTFNRISLMTNRLATNMYLPEQCVIWNALSGVIYDLSKINPIYTTINDSFKTTKWNGKNIFKTKDITGALEPNGIGLQITVPDAPAGADYDYNVLWVQTLNERWSRFRVYSYNNQDYKLFGKFSGGMNWLNNILPTGTTHNEQWDLFEWIPIPIRITKTERKIMLSSIIDNETWYSGFAFSSNPWNHCRVHCRMIYENLNKDDTINISTFQTNIGWNADRWNNAPVFTFISNTSPIFRIPFVNSGKNKIFYLIEHNNNWGPGIGEVFVTDKPGKSSSSLGNMYTTFNNPFSRHFNSKIYMRYYGIIIPKDKLPSDNFLEIKIIIPNNGQGLQIREVGTHDENPFD